MLMMNSQEAIILKKFSIQPTNNRKEILSIFLANSKPIDTQFVLDELAEKKLSIDRVTVFRTINSFVENKLLQKLEFNEGKSRYEVTLREHHHHLVCLNCGSVTCIENCNVEAEEKRIEKETGFRIASHRVEFFGLCNKCAK